MRTLIRMLARPWRDPRMVGLAVAAAVFILGAGAVAHDDQAARDKALATMIDHTVPLRRTVTGTADGGLFAAFAGHDSASQLAQDTDWIHDQIAGAVPVAPTADGRGAWGEIATPVVQVVQPAPSAVPTPESPVYFQLVFRQAVQSHATLLSGRWPTTADGTPGKPVTLEVAVTPATMSRYGLRLGSVMVLSVVPETDLRVVGVYKTDDTAALYWQSAPLLSAPELQRPATAPPYWTGAALIGGDEIPTAVNLLGPGGTRLSWTFTLDTTGYRAADAAGLDAALVNGLQISPDTVEEHSELQGLALSTGLRPTLEAFLDGQRVERSETAVPEASLAVISLVALALLARSVLRHREGECELLLARGVGLRTVALRLLGAGLVVAVPVDGAAVVVGRLLPGSFSSGSSGLMPVGSAVVVLGPALLALSRYRPRRADGRNRARRVVALVALAALCVAELQQVHAHGLAAGDGVDLFAACAPVAAAVLASILFLGGAPVVLGWLVRGARRGRGAVALLGLARTARSPGQAAATVFTLTLTLTCIDLILALRGAPQLTGAAALPQPVRDAASGTLLVVGVVALAAACVIVALAAAGDPVEQAATAARLGALGLTAGQARAVALAEACGPVALAVLGATAAAPPLAWILRPALAAALGGVGMDGWMLALPAALVAPCAALAGVGGAAAAQRGMLASLRLGDAAGGAR